jgi:4'-phosphopantetheinyl transferase
MPKTRYPGENLPSARVSILETASCGADDLDTALQTLSQQEQQRFRAFHFDQDRKDYAFAHALLRRTLSDLEPVTPPRDWLFATLPSGKPSVADRPDLDFSLTHTRGLVACAVTRKGAVGIDAETDQRAIEVDLLMRDVCSPGERRDLATREGTDKTSRFLDFWTLKEAFLKAGGLGITAELPAVSFTLVGDRDIALSAPSDLARPNSSFQIRRRPGQWRVALAVFGELDARDIEMTLSANRSF